MARSRELCRRPKNTLSGNGTDMAKPQNKEERQRAITEFVLEHGSVKIDDLQQLVSVSPDDVVPRSARSGGRTDSSIVSEGSDGGGHHAIRDLDALPSGSTLMKSKRRRWRVLSGPTLRVGCP